MPHARTDSRLHTWVHDHSRISLGLASSRAIGGRRDWSLRLTRDGQSLELPLGFTTHAGLEPTGQTQRAVLHCAAELLRSLGAIPASAAGLDIQPPAADPLIPAPTPLIHFTRRFPTPTSNSTTTRTRTLAATPSAASSGL